MNDTGETRHVLGEVPKPDSRDSSAVSGEHSDTDMEVLTKRLEAFNSIAVLALQGSLNRYGRLTDKASAALTGLSTATAALAIVVAAILNNYSKLSVTWQCILVTEMLIIITWGFGSFTAAISCLFNKEIDDFEANKRTLQMFVDEPLAQSLYSSSIKYILSCVRNEEINLEKQHGINEALIFTKRLFTATVVLIITWIASNLIK